MSCCRLKETLLLHVFVQVLFEITILRLSRHGNFRGRFEWHAHKHARGLTWKYNDPLLYQCILTNSQAMHGWENRRSVLNKAYRLHGIFTCMYLNLWTKHVACGAIWEQDMFQRSSCYWSSFIMCYWKICQSLDLFILRSNFPKTKTVGHWIAHFRGNDNANVW